MVLREEKGGNFEHFCGKPGKIQFKCRPRPADLRPVGRKVEEEMGCSFRQGSLELRRRIEAEKRFSVPHPPSLPLFGEAGSDEVRSQGRQLATG